MTGYEALRRAAAFHDISTRGRIRAAGEDRKRLVHAMTTQQVEQLEPGQGAYAFFLNAQGRVLADAVVLCRRDDLLLCLEPETRAKIFEHLDHYIIADDVTLEDVTQTTAQVAVEGPAAAEVLAGLGAALPEAAYHFSEWAGTLVVKMSVTGATGCHVIAPLAGREQLVERLRTAGVAEASAEEMEIVRLEHGQPRYGADITERYIANETGLSHALHFNKGCYLGQEVVERVRSRGHVNRVLAALRIEATSSPAPGAEILAGGKKMGEITSSAVSPAEGAVRALGYVRVEVLDGKTALTVAGATAHIVHGR
jgi:folate-binding protein YgfZ